MKIKLDPRLPLSVFRKVPFLFTAPNYKSFPTGTPFDYFSYMNKDIPALLPCTLYSKEENTINDLLFSFAFPFIDEDDCLAIYLTHPVWLENKRDPSLIHYLFDEITTYFRELGEVALFIERHWDAGPRAQTAPTYIAYPTSLTHFSYDVNKLSDFIQPSKEHLNQLQEAGIREYRRMLCYECKIETLLSNLRISSNEIRPYEILEDTPDKNLTASLKDSNSSDMIVKNYSIADQLAFISSHYAFDVADHGVVSFHDKQFVGFFQWTPNLFELPMNVLPTPFLYPDLIRAHHFTMGKIFRFGMKTKAADLFKALLHKTILIMRKKGVKICQIGYIEEQNEFLTSLLDQLGFTVIHSLQILTKAE